MSKHKLVSYLFVVLGLIIIIGASYVVYSYATGVLNAIVNFVTSNDFSTLQACGVTLPSEFNKIKSDFAGVLLPAILVGFPLLLILVSSLMFLGGFYYHRGKLEDDEKKREMLEREMVHKIVQKMEKEKPAQKSSPAQPKPVEEAEDEPPDEPEGDAPMEETADEPEEEVPRPKLSVKRRK